MLEKLIVYVYSWNQGILFIVMELTPFFSIGLMLNNLKFKSVLGKLPGLVVNVKDSLSEPWSSDVGSIPGFT